jgi:hypothetical protein
MTYYQQVALKIRERRATAKRLLFQNEINLDRSLSHAFNHHMPLEVAARERRWVPRCASGRA